MLFLKNRQLQRLAVLLSMGLIGHFSVAASIESTTLYHWAESPAQEKLHITQAKDRLQQAMTDPEYMLNHWVALPVSPRLNHKKPQQLTLKAAILLALRYNPNIQNAELDRIVQRYQLRLAHNEFELQYALAGFAVAERTRFSGVGSTNNNSFLATPEVNLKTSTGAILSLNLDNNVSSYNSYTPVLNFSFRQPLLRGFGQQTNEARLHDAIDNEWLSKLNLQQGVIDQITRVILAYRALVLSGNHLENQRLQLEEARKTYEINAKKIKAGELEPAGNIQQSYQIESLNLMREQAENDFKVAAQDLLQTIGLDPNMHLSVPTDVTLNQIVIPQREQSIQTAFCHNAEYLAQKMALKADERAYEVAKNEQLWQLDLGANVQSGRVVNVEGQNAGLRNIYNGQNTTQSAQLSLTIPIHDLNRRSQLIQAKVKLEKDRLNLIAAKRALETNVMNTITTIESLAKRYQLAQRQVKLADQSYLLEKKKFQAGIASTLDVNQTQNQLIQAQTGLINAKIAYLNQMSALQRLLGTTLKHWQIQLRYAG